MGDIKMRQKTHAFTETGSCFDTTKVAGIKSRPGGHGALPVKPINVSAFSFNKKTSKKSPQEFQKKGFGTGGTMASRCEDDNAPEFPDENLCPTKANANDRKIEFSAFVERPNPPNTEFRRFYERGDLPVQIDHGGVLQALVKCDAKGQNLVGQALIPYYRQILPVLNIFIRKIDNLGDGIDYGQNKRGDLGEMIMETLEQFERYGGDDAFINIKYLVPVYQSVILK
eukprot:scaffold1529_cov243-Chaetoceros_neogracile.AAC.16